MAVARPFLPSDKQFLITRNVPCQKRAATLGASCGEETDVYPEGGEGWVATIRNLDLTDSDAPRMTENSVPARDAASAAEAELDGMGVDLYDDDEGTLCDRETNIIKTRTYDVSISYDKCVCKHALHSLYYIPSPSSPFASISQILPECSIVALRLHRRSTGGFTPHSSSEEFTQPPLCHSRCRKSKYWRTSHLIML